MIDEMSKLNNRKIDNIGKSVHMMSSIAQSIRGKLQNDEPIFDDVSKMYDNNQKSIESTTKKIVDLLNSSVHSTLCYLMLAIIFIVFVLFLLR